MYCSYTCTCQTVFIQGWTLQSGKSQGKSHFFRVMEKSGNSVFKIPFQSQWKVRKILPSGCLKVLLRFFVWTGRLYINHRSLFWVITARIIILHGQWKLLLTIVSEKSGNLFNLTICGWQPCYIHKLCRMRSIQLHIIIHTHV